MKARPAQLIFTCEHGGNEVPADYRTLFAGRQKWLASHQGWDTGALAVARALAKATGSPLVAVTTTRLLIDLNRSAHNPAIFSEVTRALPREARDGLIARFHRPHWDRVRAAVTDCRGAVVHVAVHSFTPTWHGEPRRVGIGLLYDPKRQRERTLAIEWQRALKQRLPKIETQRNAPYRGNADGLATGLRREFADARYAGFELELNQRLVSTAQQRRALAAVLHETLMEASAET